MVPLGNSLLDVGPDPTAYYSAVGTIQLLQAVRSSLLAVFFLFLYEWFANIDDEVSLIHSSRWSSVKIAYILCRYYPLVYWPVVLWAYNLSHSPSLCDKILHAVHACLAPCHFMGQAVMFLRAYAFSGRNRIVFAILSLFYGFLLGSDVYLFFANIPVPDLGNTALFSHVEDAICFPDYNTDVMGERLGVAMLAAFLLDFFSLCVVITYCVKRYTGEIPLAVYFLKQGLVAFALICAVNVVAVIMYFQSHSAFNAVGLPFVLAMSNIIACRLILSLRKRVIVTESQMSRDHSRLVREAFGAASNSNRLTDKDQWIIHDPAVTTEIEIRPRNVQCVTTFNAIKKPTPRIYGPTSMLPLQPCLEVILSLPTHEAPPRQWGPYLAMSSQEGKEWLGRPPRSRADISVEPELETLTVHEDIWL